jgi:Tfp pilus assembly protein PilV
MRQRGVGLIEALISFLVLSIGLIGMARLQTRLRLHADMARHRSEAVHLAEQDIEALRGFTAMVPASGVHAYADIASAARTVGATSGYTTNTQYTLQRNVDDATTYRAATVTVSWPDRQGQTQQVLLQSIVAAMPPALSGALSVHNAVQPVKTIAGRSARIPANARDLGNGSSALKPDTAGTTVLVFDNATGVVSAQCDAAAGLATASLSLASLTHCMATNGLLLSGNVRFSLSAPPDAAHANDAPMPLDMMLSLPAAGTPTASPCFDEAHATASGERFVTYHCVVTSQQAAWSGRSTVVPQGWTLGTTAVDHKVCRYSADQDGSGAVDQNAEHPDTYQDVDRALMQQNFLIIKGDQACPAAPALNVATTVAGNPSTYADLSTVQHQP